MKNKEVYSIYDKKVSGSYHKGWKLAVSFYEEYLKIDQKN